ncbi:ABC transporter permease subunit [Nakamurella antarctica]|uniref:ABC transporter permease subunit n=1 Tax=Nakamurella antarctica TaxID=1902245 RepID=A0A3G8ZWJ4_9ACTN|nr:ABC transporter permease subunit [Nakamurella antarctica]AZI58366.1 ABC transporter permease subunit [Nakamurella antarctica]
MKVAALSRRTLTLSALLAPAALVVLVFFGSGVIQALAQSFGYQPLLTGWRWSTAAYQDLFSDPTVQASVWLTLRVAVIPTLLSAVLGIGAALLIRRLGRGKRWIAAVFSANLAVPHLVGALCMTLLLAQSGLASRVGFALGLSSSPADFPALTQDGFGVAIMAEYVWKETPFLAVIALAALGRGVTELEDAARALGAGPWQRFRSVTLPIIAGPVAAGSVLVFAFAAGSYEVPYLLGQPYPATLPVVALQKFQDSDLTSRPLAMAVSVLIVGFSVALVAGYLFLAGRASRRTL